MTIGSSSSSADGSYWANFAARPGTYLYESTGIRRGMWTVSWYRTLLEGPGGGEPAAARRAWNGAPGGWPQRGGQTSWRRAAMGC